MTRHAILEAQHSSHANPTLDSVNRSNTGNASIPQFPLTKPPQFPEERQDAEVVIFPWPSVPAGTAAATNYCLELNFWNTDVICDHGQRLSLGVSCVHLSFVCYVFTSAFDCLSGLGMRMKCACVQAVSASYERLPSVAASMGELSNRYDDKENNDKDVSRLQPQGSCLE
ncbi:hypothetical protein J6590_036127 [Homalodisca vitripennis]|nr:hypothetical protein J6590_036127 [Homalodisca vitripennis]